MLATDNLQFYITDTTVVETFNNFIPPLFSFIPIFNEKQWVQETAQSDSYLETITLINRLIR